MNHKYTQGPWATDADGLITAGPRRLHIAQTVTTGMGHAADANARLLAAAPDLLHLIIEVLMMVDDDNPPSPSGDWATESRAVIRKALEG